MMGGRINKQNDICSLTSNVTISYLPLCKGWNLTFCKCEDVQIFSSMQFLIIPYVLSSFLVLCSLFTVLYSREIWEQPIFKSNEKFLVNVYKFVPKYAIMQDFFPVFVNFGIFGIFVWCSRQLIVIIFTFSFWMQDPIQYNCHIQKLQN